MSPNGSPQPTSPPDQPVHVFPPGQTLWSGSTLYVPYAFERPRPRDRYWLHILLLLLTLLTTSIVGASLSADFAADRPVEFAGFDGYVRVWHHPADLIAGLPFALALLFILMCHEMGHYIAAHRYRVNATLPFFLPAPTLIGTMGAFIRIRSAVPTKRAMFDIGIAGPIAGFAALLPVLAIGVAMSKVIPGIAERGDLIFGTPLLLRGFEHLAFPGVTPDNIYLHPIARAAWAGLLATALNLLPIGQLDGGHILYAIVGERIKPLSYIFIAALLPLGYFYSASWYVWAVLLFFIARRHPVIYDPRPLDSMRWRLAWLALAILIVSFTPSPVKT